MRRVAMPRKGYQSDKCQVSHSLAAGSNFSDLHDGPMIVAVPNGEEGIFRAVIAIER